MLRAMVFVDHMNFDIAIKSYYSGMGQESPRLDYIILFRNIVKLKSEMYYTKSYIFVPKPDDFLTQDRNLSSYYNWISGMRSSKYTDVIEGRYIARPTGVGEMDIADHSTYYKVEKGTDLNLAINALSKAFYNSYDVAFILSADTDYISLYRQLKSIGKMVIVVAVKGQNIRQVMPEIDDYLILDDDFFKRCLRIDKIKTTPQN